MRLYGDRYRSVSVPGFRCGAIGFGGGGLTYEIRGRSTTYQWSDISICGGWTIQGAYMVTDTGPFRPPGWSARR